MVKVIGLFMVAAIMSMFIKEWLSLLVAQTMVLIVTVLFYAYSCFRVMQMGVGACVEDAIVIDDAGNNAAMVVVVFLLLVIPKTISKTFMRRVG